MATSCLLGKFICFFWPQFTTSWSTGKESHHCMYWLWCRTAHHPHSQLPFWRNATESSWQFLSANAVHLHHEETILGYLLLFRAHSVTESQGKSKDTGYFVGVNYPETVGYFWKTHAHIHPLIFFPGCFSWATSLWDSSFWKHPPQHEKQTQQKPSLASKEQEIIFCIMMAWGYAFQIFTQILTAQ